MLTVVRALRDLDQKLVVAALQEMVIEAVAVVALEDLMDLVKHPRAQLADKVVEDFRRLN